MCTADVRLVGAEGRVLRVFNSPEPNFNGLFGWSVSGAGAVSTDGIGIGRCQCVQQAYIFSGADGSVLHTLTSPNAEVGASFGYSVSVMEDVNHDGYSDVVVGAIREDGGDIDAGRAYIFSGADGSVLRVFNSPEPNFNGLFGWSVSGAGAVSTDGIGDFVIGGVFDGGIPANQGHVYLFVSCLADLNGDGLVGPADLAQLLGSWGPCEGCPADGEKVWGARGNNIVIIKEPLVIRIVVDDGHFIGP